MTKPFAQRLRNYMIGLTHIMRGEALSSSVFPNTTDNGQSKERSFLEILKHHVPASCNVFLGGYLFNLLGDESKQIDIIISDNQSIKFDALNKDGAGKSFACVDGTVAAFSIKSYLSKTEMFDALSNIASIPIGTPLTQHNTDPMVDLDGLSDGMLKIIYALDGASLEKTREYLTEFYSKHPNIPNDRRPNYIHVLGKYTWVRTIRPLVNDAAVLEPIGVFCSRKHDADLFFISSIFTSVEIIARLHRHLFFDYTPAFELAIPPANLEERKYFG